MVGWGWIVLVVALGLTAAVSTSAGAQGAAISPANLRAKSLEAPTVVKAKSHFSAVTDQSGHSSSF